MATETKGIKLVVNGGPVTTGTNAASGILKVLVASKLKGVQVEIENVKQSKSKEVMWADIEGVRLYEPNAIIRYIYKMGEYSISERIAEEEVIEWEERELEKLAEDGETGKEKIMEQAELKQEGGKLGEEAEAKFVVVFGRIYDLARKATAEGKQKHRKIHERIEKFVKNQSVKDALEQYSQTTKEEVVRIKAGLENRKVKPNIERDYDKASSDGVKKGEKNVLITSALPYVNNVPHLGNIVGAVLSADVYARYLRGRKINVIYVCGTDEYGTATETKALEEKVSCQELCDKYHAIHADVYKWFDISFDFFGRTSTVKQTEIVQDIFRKVEANGYIISDTVQQLYCEVCKRFLADRYVEGICPKCGYDGARGDQCDKCGTLINAIELVEPRCKLDSNRPVVKESKHLFLDLEKLQDECHEFVERSSEKGKWKAHNGYTITRSWLNEGLRPRCITRDLSWGVPVPLEGFESKVFYVWFDACIGYISLTANYTDKWEEWWSSPDDVMLYQFMGKDNVPFHTVIFPSTQIATRSPYTMLHHISSTEYLNYEGGKFSKSRGVGVFGNNARDTGIPADVWRYYLLSNRPESSDTQFTWAEFVARNNNELLANVGNFVNRILKFVDSTSKYNGVLPTPDFSAIDTASSNENENQSHAPLTVVDDVNALLAKYIASMDAVKIKAALKLAMDISARGNLFLQESKIDNTLFLNNRVLCDSVVYVAVNLVYLLSAVFAPFMPATAKLICQLLNAPTRSIPECFDFALLPGHVISTPIVHLFSRIDEKKADEWKARFGSE